MKKLEDYIISAQIVAGIVIVAVMLCVIPILSGTDFSVSSESATGGQMLLIKFLIASAFIGATDILGWVFGLIVFGLSKLYDHAFKDDETKNQES